MNRWSLIGLVLALVAVAGVLVGGVGQAPGAWPSRDADALPAGAWKDTVLFGRTLFTDTSSLIGPEAHQKSSRYAGNNLTCETCHLQAGTQKFGLPLIGVYGLFPTYIGRENDVRTLEDRIEGCMERSLNGRPLPVAGREMKALIAYLQFLSTDVPVGRVLEGRGSPTLPLLARAANPARGAVVFREQCAVCHQANGKGLRKGVVGDGKGYVFPPLWGADSFNDGAGMHRLIASASFIRANMPFGAKYDAPVLSVDDAWDVAAYVNNQPRPARAGLDRDYPDRTKKPVDAAFPPFSDSFTLEQHRFGPFQPILDAVRSVQPSVR